MEETFWKNWTWVAVSLNIGVPKADSQGITWFGIMWQKSSGTNIAEKLQFTTGGGVNKFPINNFVFTIAYCLSNLYTEQMAHNLNNIKSKFFLKLPSWGIKGMKIL